jgi:menaquinone-dependent protoporphyrinogen oxidase
LRILIGYASGFGATAEVAEEIGRVLEKKHQVAVHPLREVRSLEGYEAVVLGTSLRANRWLGGVSRFLSRFRADLANRPVALFCVCLTARTLEGGRRIVGESLPRLLARYPEVRPIAVEAFGGVLHFDKYNPLIRTIMRRAAAQEGLPTSGFVDYRDWETIRRWAAELGEKLEQGAGPGGEA